MEDVQGPDRLPEENEAFERLVNQHQPALLRYCYLYLRDQEQARDAVQETFFKAYRGWRSFRGESGKKTWLMKIALRTCHDIRKSAWFRHVDRRITPDDLPPASVPFTAEEENLITQVMQLPPNLREAVLLYYYQSMNVNEIAETLGISHSSVSDRLGRARKKLRAVLEGRDS